MTDNEIVKILEKSIPAAIEQGEEAVEKWECDLEFLEDYSHSNPIVIKIRRVIHK